MTLPEFKPSKLAQETFNRTAGNAKARGAVSLESVVLQSAILLSSLVVFEALCVVVDTLRETNAVLREIEVAVRSHG